MRRRWSMRQGAGARRTDEPNAPVHQVHPEWYDELFAGKVADLERMLAGGGGRRLGLGDCARDADGAHVPRGRDWPRRVPLRSDGGRVLAAERRTSRGPWRGTGGPASWGTLGSGSSRSTERPTTTPRTRRGWTTPGRTKGKRRLTSTGCFVDPPRAGLGATTTGLSYHTIRQEYYHNINRLFIV